MAARPSSAPMVLSMHGEKSSTKGPDSLAMS